MEQTTTQKQFILQHLQKFGSIEPLTALREYGCLRLAARIADLKKDGVNIITETKQSISSITGNPVRYAEYKLA